MLWHFKNLLHNMMNSLEWNICLSNRVPGCGLAIGYTRTDGIQFAMSAISIHLWSTMCPKGPAHLLHKTHGHNAHTMTLSLENDKS